VDSEGISEKQRQRDAFVPFPTRPRDMPVVTVIDNNVEKAIRVLKKAVSVSGVFRDLKTRERFPAPAARARRKAVEAAGRRKRDAAKRTAWKARA
jgi:small subunit ribosomal protein S21